MSAQTPRLTALPVVLEPFVPERISDRYVGWLADPDTVRYSELRHRVVDRADCEDYVRGIIDSDNHMWSIHLGLGGPHIGNLTAYVDVPNRVANLAILIGEAAARGTGAGRAAWVAACNFLLSEQGGMRKLMAGTMAENAAMMALAHTSGMIEEGRQKGHFLLDGRDVDLVWFGLFGQRK